MSECDFSAAILLPTFTVRLYADSYGGHLTPTRNQVVSTRSKMAAVPNTILPYMSVPVSNIVQCGQASCRQRGLRTAGSHCVVERHPVGDGRRQRIAVLVAVERKQPVGEALQRTAYARDPSARRTVTSGGGVQ